MALKRNRSSSQLNKLEGGTYNFTRFNYPADGLASDKIPNYVIFYINVPSTAGYNVTKAKASNGVEILSNSDKLSPQTRGTSTINESQYGNLDVAAAGASLKVVEGLASGFSGKGSALEKTVETGVKAVGAGAGYGALNAVVSTIEKKPKYNRIRTAIAMYMPDTVLQTFAHDYDAISIRDALGTLGLLQRGGSGVFGTIENAFTGGGFEAFANPEPGVIEALGRIAEDKGLVGNGFTDIILRSKGIAVNPQIEMVYKQTRNRSFIFDFRLQPRSSLESRNIKNIIREFKRYAAPSLGGNDSKGSYFTIPGQFDIQFMFKNEENRFIGKLSTCALENIDVNYSSAGPFATFDDGAPVEIALQLRFIEIDTITKELFEDGDADVDSSYSDGPSF